MNVIEGFYDIWGMKTVKLKVLVNVTLDFILILEDVPLYVMCYRRMNIYS